jgi:predicted acetyltransferase
LTSFDLNKIELIPASLADYSIIQNMARFYVYDMSEYMGQEQGWEIPNDGLYECIDFKKYWENDQSFPFLIHYQNEWAGFVIVDKKGSDKEVNFNMAQFFILRKFKNKGLGTWVATYCFDHFKGVWEVMVMPKNEGAYQFWQKTIANYTHGNFVKYTREIPHLDHSTKNIFRFES